MPTALELSREDWKRYRGSPAGQVAPVGLSEDEHAAREQLLSRVRQAAAALKARFDVHRVLLFGSLAHEAWFVPDSDVDLAVEGLPSKAYWRAWRLVEDIIGERPVDLIDMETATDSLCRAIERDGVEL
jgi:uncharacterized protein